MTADITLLNEKICNCLLIFLPLKLNKVVLRQLFLQESAKNHYFIQLNSQSIILLSLTPAHGIRAKKKNHKSAICEI